MAENYKHLYEQTKKMLTMYQDELIPGFRKQIEELEAKSKWISVTERLPETKGITSFDIDGCSYEWERSDFVLGIDVVGEMHVVQYGEDERVKWWEDESGAYRNITHWMPLPEPPKEVE